MHSFRCIFLYKKLNKLKKVSEKIPLIKIPSFLCSAYLFFVLLLSTLSLFLVCFCVFAKMLSIVCGCNLARSAHRHRHPHRHHRHAFGSKFSHFFFIGIPSFFSIFFSLFVVVFSSQTATIKLSQGCTRAPLCCCIFLFGALRFLLFPRLLCFEISEISTPFLRFFCSYFIFAFISFLFPFFSVA